MYSRGNKCQLMARSLLREVTEPAVFGFDQWVAKDTLDLAVKNKMVSRPFAQIGPNLAGASKVKTTKSGNSNINISLGQAPVVNQ